MIEMALAKVALGVNTKTFAPIYYLEARISPSRPWRCVVSNGKLCVHRSRAAAEREARKLEKRLRAKLS